MSVQLRIKIKTQKGKNALQVTMDSKDEGSKDFFGECCFIAIEEEKEEELERAFE